MTKRVFRYEIPIDDEEHAVTLFPGNPVMRVEHALFNPANKHAVEFWAESPVELGYGRKRWFRVWGTGLPIPDGWDHVGTTSRSTAGLVWHLYQKSGFPELGWPVVGETP